MPKKNKYDLGYRPSTYWDPAQLRFANIKGDWRRLVTHNLISRGQQNKIESWMLEENLNKMEIDGGQAVTHNGQEWNLGANSMGRSTRNRGYALILYMQYKLYNSAKLSLFERME